MKNDSSSENGQVAVQTDEVQQDTQSPQTSEITVQALFPKEVRPTRNWCEWLTFWENAQTYEQMLGLLHAGFSVSMDRCQHSEKEYNWSDRIEFYLKIVDWRNPYTGNFSNSDIEYTMGRDGSGNQIRKTSFQLQQEIANKALEYLCHNFFKNDPFEEGEFGKKFRQTWQAVVMDDRIFVLIQSVFSSGRRGEEVDYRGYPWIRNLSGRNDSPSHNEKIIREFLVNVAKYVWEWKPPIIDTWLDERTRQVLKEESDKTRDKLNAAKPWTIDVLLSMKNTHLLRNWIFDFNKACIAKLEEIAYSNKISDWQYDNETRLVKSLDEACFVGSQAAWLLKEHELKVRERKRLSDIFKAEQENANTKRRLKELKAK